jgi:hypothetical protein
MEQAHAAAPAAGQEANRLADILSVAVLVTVAAIALVTFRNYGLGWDDYTHAQYGELLLAFYGSGFSDRRALSFVNLYFYGGWFDMAAALLAKALPFTLFETRRLVGAAVGLIGLAATWRIGRRVAGPIGGLVALALLAACPLYYGHMFMNPKDAPFAVAMALVLLALVRAFEEYPAPRLVTVLLFGASLGLTIGSRVIGVIALVYAAAGAFVLLAAEGRALGVRPAATRFARFVTRLLPGLVLAYVVIAIAWPWGVIEPLNLVRTLVYFSHFFEKPWHELFAGVRVRVTEMPRSYVPVLFALKMPEAFLALALPGITLAFITAARRAHPLPRRAALAMLGLAAVLPIALAVATRPAMYNSIRHFVFVTPPLAALGGFAGAFAFDWLRRHGSASAVAGTLALAAALALPLRGMVRLHPYEYTFYNDASGGVAAARGRYMLDYWGLSLKQASEALRAVLARRGEMPPAGRPWKIAVCGPHPAAQVALGPQFLPTWNPQGADFAMMLGEFYCARLDAPVLVEITREGIIYARVYDIRGRTISTLFTMRPVE